MNFRREFHLPEGRVTVSPLSTPLIEPTADLLASSFVASVSHLAPYGAYVRRNIARYLAEHQAMPPRAVVLVAVLRPQEDDGGDGQAEGPHQSASDGGSGSPSAVAAPSVIGTAELSFNPSTRSSQPFLDAPERCCYLCNMAVAPAFRRRGVATKLLEVAEELATGIMNETEMFLHLRFVDNDAAKLYERAGFQRKAEHWPGVLLFGMQRMKLMRKNLQSRAPAP